MQSPSTANMQLDALLFLMQTHLDNVNAAELPETTIRTMAEVQVKLADHVTRYTAMLGPISSPRSAAAQPVPAAPPPSKYNTAEPLEVVGTQLAIPNQGARYVEPTKEEIAEFGQGVIVQEEVVEDGVGKSHFVRTVQDSKGYKSKRMSMRQLDDCIVGEDGHEAVSGVSYATTTFEGDVGKRTSVKMYDHDASQISADCMGMLTDGTVAAQMSSASYSSGAYSEATTEYKGNYSKRASMHQMESVRAEQVGDVVDAGDGALVPANGSAGSALRAVREQKQTYAVTEQVVVDDQVQSIRTEDRQHVVEDALTGQMLGARGETIETQGVTDMLTGMHQESRKVDYVEDTVVAAPGPAPAGTKALCDDPNGQALAVAGGGTQLVRTYGATTEEISVDMVLGEERKVQAHSFQAVDARTGQVLKQGDGVQEKFTDDFGTEQVSDYAVLDAVTGVVDQGSQAKSVARGLGENGGDAIAVTQERQLVDAYTGALIEHHAIDAIKDAAGESTATQFAIADGTGLVHTGGQTTDVTKCQYTGAVQTVQSSSEAVVDAVTGATLASKATGTQAIADHTGETALHQYSTVDGSGILREGQATHTTQYSLETGESQTSTKASHMGYDMRTGQVVESAQTASEGAHGALGDGVTVQKYAIADASGVVREGTNTKIDSYSAQTGQIMSSNQAQHTIKDASTGQLLEIADIQSDLKQGSTGIQEVHTYAIQDASGVIHEGEQARERTVAPGTGELVTTTSSSSVSTDARTGQILDGGAQTVRQVTGADGKTTTEGARSYIDPRTGQVVTERVGGPLALGNGEPSRPPPPSQPAPPSQPPAPSQPAPTQPVQAPPPSAPPSDKKKRPDDKESKKGRDEKEPIAHPRRERRVMQFDPELPTQEEIAEFGQDAVVTLVKGEDGHLIRTVTDAKSHRSRRQSVKRMDVSEDGVKQSAVAMATTEFTGDKGHRHSIKMTSGKVKETGEKDKHTAEARTEYSGTTAKRTSVHSRDCAYVDHNLAIKGPEGMAMLENGEAPADSGAGSADTAPMMKGQMRTYAVTEMDYQGDVVTKARKEETQHTVVDAKTGKMVTSHGQVSNTKNVTDELMGVSDVQGSTQYVTYSNDGTRTEGVIEQATDKDHIMKVGGTTTVHSKVVHDAATGQLLGSSQMVQDASGGQKGENVRTAYEITDHVTGTVHRSDKVKSNQALENGEYVMQENEHKEICDVGGTLIHAASSNASSIAGATGETTERSYQVVDAERGLVFEGVEGGQTKMENGVIVTHEKQRQEAVSDLKTGAILEGKAMSMDQGQVTNAEKWYVDPVTGQLRHEVLKSGNQLMDASPPPQAPAQPAPPAQPRSPDNKARPGSGSKPAPPPINPKQEVFETKNANVPKTPRGQVSCHFRVPVLKSAMEKESWSKALCNAFAAVGSLDPKSISLVGSVQHSTELARVQRMIDYNMGSMGSGSIALARWHAQLGGLAQPCSIVVLRLEPGVDWNSFSEKVTKVLTQRRSAASRDEAARVLGEMVNPEAVDLLLD